MGVRVGTSGWDYDHWDGVLYPPGTPGTPGTPGAQRLARYVERFDTVELNASFYRWPRDATFASWQRRLPPGFAMSVKAPRGLTHAKRLYGPERWAARISAAWHELGAARAVLLVQLRPDHTRDDARLAFFLDALPAWVRVAVELRHPSWFCEPVYDLLEARGASLVAMSGAHLPCVLRATSSLVYVRLHGPSRDHLYAGSYPEDDLRWWADRCREWADGGRDVLAYFNNDGEGNAVRNALRLRELVGC